MTKKERTRVAVLQGLLENKNVRETSKATGISEEVIYRHLADPEFSKEYDEKRMEMLRDSCHTLQRKMSRATDELVAIIEDPETNKQTKVYAIDMLFRHAYKQTEQLDILARLDALENMEE